MHPSRGPVYSAVFAAVAVSAAQDVFEIVAPATSRVVLREVRLGQYSDAGDAEAELLSVTFLRGHTTTGSGGAAVTPANLMGVTGSTAAVSTVARNNTTVATGGSPVTLLADSFHVAAGFRWYPAPEEQITLEPSQRFVVRISAPADSITLNGTLVFQEIGKMPIV